MKLLDHWLLAFSRMYLHGHVCNRGASLLYLIASLAVIGAISTGVSRMTPSSSQTKITEQRSLRAYYLALSGQNLWPNVQSSMTDNTTYTYTIGTDTITLMQIADVSGTTYTVTAQGVCDPNTPHEANYRLVRTRTVSGGDVLSSPLDSLTTDSATGITTVDDESPNNNPGVVKGLVSGSVTTTEGVVDSAVHFDCSNYARIVYSGIPAYNIFYSGSIAMWFNADNFDNQNAGLLHKGASNVSCQSSDSSVYIFSDEVYTLQFVPGSSDSYVRLRFVIIDGTQNTGCTASDSRCLCRNSRSWRSVAINSNTQFRNRTSRKDYDTKKWYFVVATWYYDSSTTTTYLKLYVNGVLDSTVTAQPFTPRTNTAPIVIGSQQDANTNVSGTVFCGSIDDVNVYSTPLSADFIEKYYCKYKSTDSICN